MIREQLTLFGAAIGFGFAAGLLYCILCRFSVWFRMRTWLCGIRDLLYGSAAGLALYYLLLYMDDGVLHGYVVLGASVGWITAYGVNKLPGIMKKRLTRRKE